MRQVRLWMAAVMGLALSTGTSWAVISLNFSSTVGASIQFNGAASTFQFNQGLVRSYNPAGDQWHIISESGVVVPTAVGLFGDILNGPFAYGPITVNGANESAPVIGPLGGLLIKDALNIPLTGTVNWVTVSTSGSAGALNAALTVNVTGMSYLGANPDLLALVGGAAGSGAMNLTFQFSPGMTLQQLTAGAGPYKTTYSGSISPVPEPTTMIAGALLLLPFGASTLRLLRKR